MNSNRDYILIDGSDIQKKYARFIEGLGFVKDGDKGTIGLGYWLMNAMHFGRDGEMTQLYNKLYSYDRGANSETKEVMEVVNEIQSVVDKNGTFIYDRGMDRPICRDFMVVQ